MSEPQLQMPRACDSCEHYKPVGWDEDKHCPFKGQSASSPKQSASSWARKPAVKDGHAGRVLKYSE